MDRRTTNLLPALATLSDEDLLSVTGGHHHKHHDHDGHGGKGAGGKNIGVAQNNGANINVFAPNNNGVIEIIVNQGNAAGIAA